MPSRPTKSADDLTLEIDGKISAAKFRQAVNAFLDLVDEVTRSMSGPTPTLRWIVTVESGSARLRARPEQIAKQGRRAPAVARAVEGGLRLLGRRAQRPKHFSGKALQRIRELAKVPDGHDVTRATVRVGSSAVDVVPKTAENVETLLSPRYREIGTVEGRLQTLSDRGGVHFVIYDALTDDPVRCIVDPGQVDMALRAWRKRVAVTGLLRYRKDGEPISIDVEDIEEFPPESELPTADEVFGILSAS